MSDRDDEPHDAIREGTRDETSSEDDRDRKLTEDDGDRKPASAQTRAGSNLPNAAGNRNDGTHE